MPLVPAARLPANLSAPCEPLPLLDDGQQVTMVQWMITASDLYRSCAARHAATVHAIEGETP